MASDAAKPKGKQQPGAYSPAAAQAGGGALLAGSGAKAYNAAADVVPVSGVGTWVVGPRMGCGALDVLCCHVLLLLGKVVQLCVLLLCLHEQRSTEFSICELLSPNQAVH